MKAKVLIVEDQFVSANNLRLILERADYTVLPIARSVEVALNIIAKNPPDLVLLDIYLQGELTGIDLGSALNERNIAFVYVSANSGKQTLDAAKKTRPYGFLVKPFKEQDVLATLDVAWYIHRYNKNERNRNTVAEEQNGETDSDALQHIIGQSPVIREVLKKVKIVGPSNTSVLICGESGTGKELIAQAIHKISQRKSRPLVVVNCAALPANLIESELFGHEKGSFTGANLRRIGKFEQADGGTIFLDEIGELPLDLQVKFLRVLQEMEIERIGGITKKIDVRVIAATNRNLEEEIAKGNFRLDLYYRLNIFPITLPALRERKTDLIPLANFFLNKYARKEKKNISGFSDNIIQMILEYSWPGNVRELENMMARSVLLAIGTEINTLVLPKDKGNLGSAFQIDRIKTMQENERDHIIATLERCDWKVYGEGGAAELLDMNVSTLNSRIRKLGIQKQPSVNRK